jgi:hypothetical protein
MAKKFLVVVAVLGLSAVISSQAKNEIRRLSGAWKLNIEKSQFNPGPGPKSQVLTWKPTATGVDFTVDTVTSQGQTTRSHANGTYDDGKPFAFKTATYSGMRTVKWIDAHTFEETDTVDGKLRNSRRVVISADGKVLTITTKGVNAQGQPTSNVTVYEKQ